MTSTVWFEEGKHGAGLRGEARKQANDREKPCPGTENPVERSIPSRDPTGPHPRPEGILWQELRTFCNETKSKMLPLETIVSIFFLPIKKKFTQSKEHF